MASSQMEQRVNLKFLVKLGKTATEALTMLTKVYGDECLSRTQVFEWFKRFKEGRESTVDQGWAKVKNGSAGAPASGELSSGSWPLPPLSLTRQSQVACLSVRRSRSSYSLQLYKSNAHRSHLIDDRVSSRGRAYHREVSVTPAS